MKFQLEINCDNAAFEDDPKGEIARILANAREAMLFTGFITKGEEEKLRDFNGNAVGFWKFTD